jgi:hypothetical protein
MFDPIAMILADKTTKRHVTSAGPHAPVRRDRRPRRPPNRLRAERPRLLIATMLRRMANRIEPTTFQSCQPSA